MKSDFIKLIESIKNKKITDFKLNKLLDSVKEDWKGTPKEQIIKWIKKQIIK